MKRFKKILLIAIASVSSVVFLIASFNLVQAYFYTKSSQDDLEKLKDTVLPSPKTNVNNDKETDEKHKKTLNFKELFSLNSDIIGWIDLPNTSLSYPLVQGKDNAFYLTHNFKKEQQASGSIFIDSGASEDFLDKNTFVYGHNVYYGTMFAELENYMYKDYFTLHPYIYIYTSKTNYRLDVFSAYEDSVTSYSYQPKFANEQIFDEYLTMIQKKSNYKTNVRVTSKDRIITLSTCSYPIENEGRHYIHAKIVEI